MLKIKEQAIGLLLFFVRYISANRLRHSLFYLSGQTKYQVPSLKYDYFHKTSKRIGSGTA